MWFTHFSTVLSHRAAFVMICFFSGTNAPVSDEECGDVLHVLRRCDRRSRHAIIAFGFATGYGINLQKTCVYTLTSTKRDDEKKTHNAHTHDVRRAHRGI